MSLKNNYLVQKLYKAIFYFELGRSTASRVYGFIPEIIIILGGLKYLFKIEFSNLQLVSIILFLLLMFFITGYFLKKSGLYDADRYVQASKDPVMNELLEASRRKKK